MAKPVVGDRLIHDDDGLEGIFLYAKRYKGGSNTPTTHYVCRITKPGRLTRAAVKKEIADDRYRDFYGQVGVLGGVAAFPAREWKRLR